MTARRQLLLRLVSVAPFWLAGPAKSASDSEDGSRTYCLKHSKTRRKVCTPERVPFAETEALAKQFLSTPGALTVYLVRYSWIDSVRPLRLALDESTHVGTLPKSLIWMRLRPGRHTLGFEWDGKLRQHAFEGGAGEVRFIEVAGSSLPLDPPYHWSDIDTPGAMVRARKSRLIADIQQ